METLQRGLATEGYQPLRSDQSLAAGVRFAGERLVGEDAHPVEGLEEVVYVQPGPSGFDLPSRRMAGHEAPERQRSRYHGDGVEQLATRRLYDDPIRCGGVHAVREPVVLKQVQWGNVQWSALRENRHGDLRR